MKLYELTQRWNEFSDAVDDGLFDDPELIESTLEAIEEAFDEKAEHIALLIKNLSAEAEAIKAETAKLTARAKTKENTVERLRTYLGNHLLMIGQEKLETARCKLTFRKSESVIVADEQRLFDACRNSGIDGLAQTVETVKFDKTAIKKAIKDGAALDGAYIEVKKNLQIK